MQEEIDSYDSQLDKTIKAALQFSTHTLPKIKAMFVQSNFNRESKETDTEKREQSRFEDEFDKECIQDLLDTYKDDVFGESAKVSMENFNKIMTTTQKWAFDTDLCRKRAIKYLQTQQ